jgi:hypothetical protein
MPSLSSRVCVAVLATGAAILAAACGAHNPNFCEGSQCDEVDAAPDSRPVSCTADGPDTSCPAAMPVCESGECTGSCTTDTDCAGRPSTEAACHVASGACVQCDESDAQATPGEAEDECPAANLAVCDGDTHTCRACEAHSECFSGVCDAGRCAPAAEVIYMSANGTDGGGNNCDNPAPGQGCLTMQAAIGKLTATRKYIVMEPSATPYQTRGNAGTADFNGDTAFVIGTGASLRRTGDGEVVQLHGDAAVTIEGLTIERATGASGAGISCSTATLELRKAVVRQNETFGILGGPCTLRAFRSTFALNQAGGISLTSGTFNLVNNFIVSNGGLTTSTFGGVSLSSVAATNTFEFNTVALNSSQAGNPDGVSCSNAGLVARNNIIVGSATRQHVNPGTNCTHRYTLFTPDNGVTDEGNMTILDQSTYNFASANDFHIGAGSVAAGKAQSTNLSGETLFDVDGNARTLDGTTVDVGADEIP